jgi:hypothetical protein
MTVESGPIRRVWGASAGARLLLANRHWDRLVGAAFARRLGNKSATPGVVRRTGTIGGELASGGREIGSAGRRAMQRRIT